jgi:maleate isomerase
MAEVHKGVRARIGFTSVACVTEVFPKVFYEVVPDGVVLSLLTVQHLGFSPEAMARIHEEIMSHARAFARARCNVIFLGSAPTNLAHGWEHLRRVLRELEAEFGVPVTSNATAQNKALAALGGKKVGVVHPYKGMTGLHDQQISDAGMQLAGYFSGGVAPEDYHLIPTQQAFDWGVQLKREHPAVDTIFFACPHWNVMDAIEPLEQELKINVVAAGQAVIWEGLRLAGIDDRIAGYGRLLREQ